jgi:putative heme-binding domain-containing protein
MSHLRTLACFPLLCAVALAQHTTEGSPDAAAESDSALFRKHCASCHGKGGEGGRAPSLTGRLHAGDGDADMARVISGGLSGTEMSSYEARLGPEKIARIVAYVRSVKRTDPPMAGDAARGAAVFWGKGGCGNCHAAGDRGNRVGPDLSRIGRQRSAGYLRESLLAPGADIVANYEGVTVVTSDGKTVRGIAKGRDEFYVVLQDFSGKVYSFDRSALRSVTQDTQSLMPEYGKALSASELDDVLAYLFTLGTTEVKR